MSMATLKQRLGCWAHERWRTEWALAARGNAWLDLCNRHESLTVSDGGRARVCNWRDTSLLTVCRTFPAVGARLLRRCMRDWPIEFADTAVADGGQPEASIIIAFRGIERLAQLQCCLATLQAQRHAAFEIILVEQSWEALLSADMLPGVRHIHARSTSPDMPFNKSWAMNIGARQARADTLIFHDGDMLAPADYVQSALDLMWRGYQGARVPRLVFYPDRATSEAIQGGRSLLGIQQVGEVRQNCRGISLVMQKTAYWEIGGHDESFYGWGGEDDEILQRAETLNFYPGGFMPFVHLWHPVQKEKHSNMYERMAFSAEKMASTVTDRIIKLTQQKSGSLNEPTAQV